MKIELFKIGGMQHLEGKFTALNSHIRKEELYTINKLNFYLRILEN